MIARCLRYRDYQLGIGHKKDGSGIISPIVLKCQNYSLELGYRPKGDWRHLKKKKKRWCAFDFDCFNDRIYTPSPKFL